MEVARLFVFGQFVSKVLQRSYKVFLESFKGLLGKLQDCYKDKGCYKNFFQKVFQEVLLWMALIAVTRTEGGLVSLGTGCQVKHTKFH